MIRKYLAILAVVVLAGCASDGGEKSGSQAQPAPKGSSGNTTQGLDSSNQGNGRPIDGSDNASGSEAALAAALKSNIIYFAYDSSEINSEGLAILDVFGKYLVGNAGAKLRLEGHTDERGSREYNIGLGERRAIAVQSALVARGASPGQLSVISYGEERPAAPEHDEAAYAKNRRVEITRP
jgi:peptidoglycan-associated lipoprotein